MEEKYERKGFRERNLKKGWSLMRSFTWKRNMKGKVSEKVILKERGGLSSGAPLL